MLEFDNEAHIYYYNGEVVPNVTSIIEMTGLTNFSFIPQNDLKMACQYGDLSHKITIYTDLGIDKLEDIVALNEALKEKYQNFNIKKCLVRNYESYKQFLKDYDYNPLMIEEQMYSHKYKFAGTMDRVCLINGKEYILDFKTGVKSKTCGIQTSAYKILLEELNPKYKKIKRAILHFENEGGYKLYLEDKPNDIFDQELFKDRQIFLSALTFCHLGFSEALKKKAKYHYMNNLACNESNQ